MRHASLETTPVTATAHRRPGIPIRHAWIERPGSGFTVIELLIVLAVVGLLLTIAVPQYQQFLQRGHRVEAITLLTEAAACQERIRAGTGAYDPDRCVPLTAENGHYRLTSGPGSDDTAGGYVLTATPVNPSKDDRCGSLSLDHTGRRRISGPAANHWACWSGR
jgi:type IV pilus assembly protein PilE